MELKAQLKAQRVQHGWTQKILAEKLNVSDKTVSSWETGRSYPDIEMLLQLSELFQISLDEFLRGDTVTIKQIDRDLKSKKVYQRALLVLLAAIIGLFIFLNLYQYKNQWVDRFNPLLTLRTGYATLPAQVTYNGGKEYKKGTAKLQVPDPYKNIWVVDSPFGDGTRLSFQGGQAPGSKHYALIQHKGLYVKRLSFVSWRSIPSSYQNIMAKKYERLPDLANEPVHH
ncbi:helix-turn-helix domain-containing protein [Loigolactobacillus zhaoyuanensis]|uniref:helix-turn-helix domain-containing protein n=1 Tax=Loigolactobacillus zhaoyuanensis TaxID=2486017 RepID=UPI000F7365E8|nr:helix-turn-helix domain-containing protein [Loigolactobacillus zhaoyuanensis]